MERESRCVADDQRPAIGVQRVDVFQVERDKLAVLQEQLAAL